MEEDEGEAEDGEMEDEGGRQSIGFKFLFGFYRILVLCKKYEQLCVNQSTKDCKELLLNSIHLLLQPCLLLDEGRNQFINILPTLKNVVIQLK